MSTKMSLRRPALICAGAGLLVGSIAITACRGKQTASGPKTTPPRVRPAPVAPGPKAIAFGKDVTAELRALNSSRYAPPPRSFRKIKVRPRPFSPRNVKRHKDGFEVRFPSRAPITTPAVYKGRIYVSGGFKSKEFYAFSATTGKPEWGVSLGDDGPSAPACDDDICVFNTESCTVFALDAKTGKLIWSHWLGDPQLSAPSIANGRVFTSYPTKRRHGSKARPPGASHVIAAFALKTGKLLWQRWIDADVMSAPVAAGTELFVTTFAGTVVELDQATGQILSAFKARATSAPIVTGNDVFFTQRVDPKGAKEVQEGMVKRRRTRKQQRKPGKGPSSLRYWPGLKFATKAPARLLANLGTSGWVPRRAARTRKWLVAGGPAPRYRPVRRRARYLDKRVQQKSYYFKAGEMLDAHNGFTTTPSSAKAGVAAKLVGQGTVSRLQSFQGSRVLHFGARNFNTMGDELMATDPVTGAKLWSMKIKGNVSKTGGFLATPPVAAGRWLVLGLTEGQVLVVDPKTGDRARTFAVGAPVRSQPIVHNGWIYVGTSKGRLVAINSRDKRLTGWTQWGGDARRSATR